MERVLLLRWPDTDTAEMPDMDLCERKERAMVVECVGDERAGGSKIVQYL